MSTTFTATSTVELKPEQLAEAFWNMNDEEQVAFFTALHDLVRKTYEENRGKWWTDPLGESQWWAIAKLMQDKGKVNPAGKILMAMAANLYHHTYMKGDWS